MFYRELIFTMKYNMSYIYPNWNFEVTGISTIEDPRDNTILYIELLNKEKLNNLAGHKYCVVIAENGIVPNGNTCLDNFFIFTDYPKNEFESLVKQTGV